MAQPQDTPSCPPDVVADDHRFAAWLATTAGELLVGLRTTGLEAGALKDLGDRASHELLMRRLADHRPQDKVLSEEGKDDRARLESDRVWIIDPVDGTREYGEPHRDDWAVHVALWSGVSSPRVRSPNRASASRSRPPTPRRSPHRSPVPPVSW